MATVAPNFGPIHYQMCRRQKNDKSETKPFLINLAVPPNVAAWVRGSDPKVGSPGVNDPTRDALELI
jgi:hypothetical protein